MDYNNLIVGQGGGGGKKGGGSGRVAVEDPDSLQSMEIARVVDLISEGEIQGLAKGYQSIYYGGTPLQNADGTFNFTNVTVEARYGTQNQLPLENVNGVESEKQVNAEITYSNPVEQTITDPNVNSIYITLGIPQLTLQDTKTGDLHGSSVSFSVSISSAGGPFTNIPVGFVASTTSTTFFGTLGTLRDASTSNSNNQYGYNSMGGWDAVSPPAISTVGTVGVSSRNTVPAIVGYTGVIENVNSIQTTLTFGVRVRLLPTENTLYSTIAIRYRKVGTTTWTIYNTFSTQILRTNNYTYNSGVGVGGINWSTVGVVSQDKFVTYTATIQHPFDRYEYEVVDYTPRAGSVVAIVSAESSIQRYDISITGKTITRYQRGIEINLPGSAPWIVRVTRTTPDSTISSLSNKSWWDTYTEITKVKLNYPNSALIFTGIDAKQFSAIPTRAFEIEGIKCKVPNNYNSRTRTYTGYWDGGFITAWTNNPAWIFYDLVTNTRYGLGELIPSDLVDKWELYSVGQYCDETVYDGYGQPEPRFTCNLYLQTKEDAYKVVGNLASVFRAMAFWSNGSISVSQDRPTDVTAIFNSSNIIDGEFSYSGTSSKVRHNAVLVSWNNPKNMYKLEVEYVEDAEDIANNGLRQTDIVAMGCTSRTQAHRLGKWLLYTEKYENEFVSFKTGLDGLVVGLGSVIQTQDQFRSGKRLGGRVNFSSTTSLDVDSDVVIESGKTYELTMVLPTSQSEVLPNNTIRANNKGEIISKILTNSPGTTRHLTWAGEVSKAPQPNSLWVVSVSDLSLQTWRVTNIKEINTTQAEITALKYNSQKFAAVEQDIMPEEAVINAIDTIPGSPTVITYQEYPAYISPGVLSNKVTLSWDSVPGASKYLLSYIDTTRLLNKVEITLGNVTSTEIFPIDIGEYSVSIAAISPLGKFGAKTTISMDILGKTAPPSNIANFNYTFKSNGIELIWDAIPDVDLLYYEIRVGDSWETGTLVENNLLVTSYLYSVTNYGTYKFWIAARDTSKNYSRVPTQLNVEVLVPSTTTGLILNIEGSNYNLSWVTPYSVFEIDHYIIRRGASLASSTIVTTTKSNSIDRFINYSGNMTYYVAAVDIAGNIGTYGFITHSVLLPLTVSVTTQVIDNNVLLYWTDATSTLPIDTYEIRKGSIYSTAEVVGTKSGRFTSLSEIVSNTYTYWVVGIDSAGNRGVPASISTSVSQPKDYTIVTNVVSTFSGTKNNAIIENSTLVLPLDTAETFATHFSSRSWTSPNSQINAGYPLFIEPVTSSGYYEEIIDLGAIVNNARVTVNINSATISGTPTITNMLSVKSNIGDSWIDYDNTLTVYASAYRYIKIRTSVTANTPTSFVRINSINAVIDIKVISDAGSTSCLASDIGGTIAYFNTQFADVSSIVVSASGTTPITAIYDFTDVPNPTSFKILLFNSAGTRVNGTASWSVKGY